MKKTKYMMSGGLAFSEQKDMEKLHKKSLKGWHVKSFKFMGYELEYGEKEDVIYNIDYRVLEEDEKEEYMEFFSSAGWTHVCSEANMHLFKAPSNTTPIYSDKDSKVEKYQRLGKLINGAAGVLLVASIAFFLLSIITTGTFKDIARIGFFGVLALTVPAMMTAAAVYYQKLRLKI
ncbi:Protein of unknown function [Mesobacillus persicus]|uniref:DUF2812 domain-containing protein n=1 Tax=Mesobacillus persicus TaxID=930146 RepID=A0A1H8DEU2_9BACI|nr:DUF2812 domain-containing protein [Mesobacillus persicus]SEN05676.1 Protein of unknown function [Mesobacillus persicus]